MTDRRTPNDDVAMRIARLELWRDQAEVRFAQLNTSLHENTVMTAEVKRDTQLLVDLLTASKINLRIIKWMLGAGVALTGLWQGWRHLS